MTNKRLIKMEKCLNQPLTDIAKHPYVEVKESVLSPGKLKSIIESLSF